MANRIIVTQIGARHRYVIPRVLERCGLLSRFYTDSTNMSLLGRCASFLWSCGFRFAPFARLRGRGPNIPKGKLYTSDILFFKSVFKRLFSKDTIETQLLVFDGLSNQCIKWGVGNADCVYGMYFENFRFLAFAKSRGLKIVADIYERPMTYKLLIEEIKSNDEYSVFQTATTEYEKKHEVRMMYINRLLELADYYTVPSKNVEKSLREFSGFDENKVLYLPYASSICPDSYHWCPRKHRLLFVGSDIVNKGLLYCARAATTLKGRFPDLDFRIVGLSRDERTNCPVFDDLNFLGFLGKEQLEAEYSNAEAFVFPTLFEGFAGAVIEAACCGCPIITTENAGMDVSEFPAIYVREKSSDAIVDAVTSIFENSELRDDLSKRAYDYSKHFSPSAYENRLINCFKSI